MGYGTGDADYAIVPVRRHRPECLTIMHNTIVDAYSCDTPGKPWIMIRKADHIQSNARSPGDVLRLCSPHYRRR